MITEDVPKKYEDLDFTPPTAAQDNAQQAIDWKEEHGDEVTAMNQTGWERAHQLADGDELSPDVVDRMAQFSRHEKNKEVADQYKDEPWKDNGKVAWLGWGGDEGIEWAQDMADKMDKRDKQNESVKLTENRLRQIIREELNEASRVTTADNLKPYVQGKTVAGTRKGEGSLHEGGIVIQFRDGSEISIGKNGGILIHK